MRVKYTLIRLNLKLNIFKIFNRNLIFNGIKNNLYVWCVKMKEILKSFEELKINQLNISTYHVPKKSIFRKKILKLNMIAMIT